MWSYNYVTTLDCPKKSICREAADIATALMTKDMPILADDRPHTPKMHAWSHLAMTEQEICLVTLVESNKGLLLLEGRGSLNANLHGPSDI